MMYFLCGVVGFCGYEALRSYGLMKHGKKPFSVIGPLPYGIILASVSMFSGVVAHVFSGDDIARSIYIGFTLPTGISTIMSVNGGRHDAINVVEDIQYRGVSGIEWVKIAMINYFYLWR